MIESGSDPAGLHQNVKFLLHKLLRFLESNKAIKMGVVGFFNFELSYFQPLPGASFKEIPQLSNDPKDYAIFVYLCFLIQNYLNTENKTFEGFKVKLSCQCCLAVLGIEIDKQHLGRRKGQQPWNYCPD